jgi:hypothetical protein
LLNGQHHDSTRPTQPYFCGISCAEMACTG